MLLNVNGKLETLICQNLNVNAYNKDSIVGPD